MFAPLPSPELAYQMFKLRERELLREAEVSRLASLRRVGPSRWHRLMVNAANALESMRDVRKGLANARGGAHPA